MEHQPVVTRHVWLVSEGERVLQERPVVLEEPLALYINGQQAAVLMRLPGMEKELAIGFCLSEGLVRRFADILMVHHCGQGLPEPAPNAAEGDPFSRNRVDMRVAPEGLNPSARLEVVRLIRAGCGAVDVARAELPLEPLSVDLTVSAETILSLGRALRQNQSLHEAVGGVHAVALFDASGTLLALAEDVGRHNAMDKVIGYAALYNIPLEDKILLSSGRLSYEMVSKALRVRIPVLVSLSAPTALAVSLAERFGQTLIGYLRRGRMTVYSHAERMTYKGERFSA
ncbi:MAG: formate dehydrogenase accessory sulfurtransferase FdhD [Chloroflexi bacterium]|nr:formate dehydrogenase accessory sulfurtransferase FdhD [Chloroflexota bacterium]